MSFEEFKEKLKTVMNYYKLDTKELNLASIKSKTTRIRD